MYNVSNAYLDKILNDRSNISEWFGTIQTRTALYNWTNHDLKAGNNRFIRNAIAGNVFSLGTVCSGQVELNLFLTGDATNGYYLDNKQVSANEFIGGQITLTYRLYLTDETYEDVPCGTFDIVNSTRTSNTLTLTANDYMLRFNKAASSISTQAKPYYFINVACTACGVQVGNTQTEIEAMLHGTDSVTLYPGFEFNTWRDMISAIAIILGCSAVIGRDNKLYFKPWTMTSVRTVPTSWRYDSNIADYTCNYNKIQFHRQSNNTTPSHKIGVLDGLTLDLGDNPFVQYEQDSWVWEILDDLNDVIFTPADIKCPADPALDIMDVITVEGNQAGNGVICGLTTIEISLNAAMQLKCEGINPAVKDINGNISNTLSSVVDKTSSDALYYYDFTNDEAITINSGQNKQVINIVFATAKKTHVDFHGTILSTLSNVQSSGKVKITVSYLLNNVVVDTFVPTHDWGAVSENDSKIITLMYAWVMDGGYESSFKVKIEVEGATLSIGAYQINAWLAGCGLAEEEEGGQSEKPWKDSQITVEEITITQNGTYTAPDKTAYSPITVNVEVPPVPPTSQEKYFNTVIMETNYTDCGLDLPFERYYYIVDTDNNIHAFQINAGTDERRKHYVYSPNDNWFDQYDRMPATFTYQPDAASSAVTVTTGNSNIETIIPNHDKSIFYLIIRPTTSEPFVVIYHLEYGIYDLLLINTYGTQYGALNHLVFNTVVTGLPSNYTWRFKVRAIKYSNNDTQVIFLVGTNTLLLLSSLNNWTWQVFYASLPFILKSSVSLDSGYSSLIYYKDTLHALCGGNRNADCGKHFIYDGSAWTELNQITSFNSNGNNYTIIFNDELHLYNYAHHSIWNEDLDRWIARDIFSSLSGTGNYVYKIFENIDNTVWEVDGNPVILGCQGNLTATAVGDFFGYLEEKIVE